GPLKRAMHRIATQQAGTLDQIVSAAFAHYDGAKSQYVSTTRLVNQQACDKTTNTPKAIEHNVFRGRNGTLLSTQQSAQLTSQKSCDVYAVPFTFPHMLDSQLAKINVSVAQVQFGQLFQQRIAFK